MKALALISCLALAACADQAALPYYGGYSSGSSDLEQRVQDLEDQNQQLQSDVEDLQSQLNQ